jgi:hypothetical protein
LSQSGLRKIVKKFIPADIGRSLMREVSGGLLYVLSNRLVRGYNKALYPANPKIKLGFVIHEVTYLKALMPLIRFYETRYPIYIFLLRTNIKRTSPVRNGKYLRDLKPYRCIWYESSEEIMNHCRQFHINNLFTLEGMPFVEEDYSKHALHLFIVTHMTDFYQGIGMYYEKADWILFHSKYDTRDLDYHDKNKKFLYTGYSQYLAIRELNKSNILRKYQLPDKEMILIMGPQKINYERTQSVINLICDYARAMNWHVVYKTRSKNPPNSYIRHALKGFDCLYDETLFPPTSLELMHVSDIVVNFDSTGIQEMVMLEKKIINFFTKPHRRFEEITQEKAIPDLPLDIPEDSLRETLSRVMHNDLQKEIREIKGRYYTDVDHIEKKFLDLEEKFGDS